MKYFLIILFTILLKMVVGQSDTAKIFDPTPLKRGFYKNYQEFINNDPSVITPFNVIVYKKSKKDTTIIAASYQLPDTTQSIHHVWGFCDGNAVFVKYSRSMLKKQFWKLSGTGPHPYFIYKHKDIYAIGPGLMALATAAATAASGASYDMMVINEKGKAKQPSVSLVRKLLKKYPSLLQSFNKEIDKLSNINMDTSWYYDRLEQILEEYIIKLNGESPL